MTGPSLSVRINGKGPFRFAFDTGITGTVVSKELAHELGLVVETRFKLPSLTKRDAAQMDMTELFDFTSVPWRTPPAPPTQPTDGSCYLNHRP